VDADTQARLEALVMPDAWADYQTLPPLNLDALLTLAGGNVTLLAATVLRYVCESLRVNAESSGALDIKLGSLAIKETGAVSVQGRRADVYCQRAAQLDGQARRSQSGRSVSVPVEVGW
jgi:hypothetical protein